MDIISAGLYNLCMKALTIPDAAMAIPALEGEIRRSQESRYDHRLHGILLVAKGMSYREVAGLLGVAHSTVANWVRRYDAEGLAGLVEGDRPGRPKRLTEEHLIHIAAALRKSPEDFGLSSNLWDGRTLAAFIGRQCQIGLGVRQCQRLFRQFGYRLRQPRPLIAGAGPAQKGEFNQNPLSRRR
jgi:transposase